MTPSIHASAPERTRVEIILSNGFVATELAAVLDVLRIANRLLGTPLFALRIATCAQEARPVSLGGLAVAADAVSADDPPPDVLVVAGGAGVVRPGALLKARLQRTLHSGGGAILLSDAVPALSSGRSRAAPVVVHWESMSILSETGGPEAVSTDLFIQRDGITTCAGMAATYDAMLALVAERASGYLAEEVARILLLERRRPGGTSQPQGHSDTAGLPDGPLREALKIMEGSIEFPRPTPEIARAVGISTRQLERLFAKSFGQSPQQYHRSLRLRRARVLIESSHMSVMEIALACGFGTPSHFSRLFRRTYGTSPFDLRRRTVVGISQA